jgi:hypothetical protein
MYCCQRAYSSSIIYFSVNVDGSMVTALLSRLHWRQSAALAAERQWQRQPLSDEM